MSPGFRQFLVWSVKIFRELPSNSYVLHVCLHLDLSSVSAESFGRGPLSWPRLEYELCMQVIDIAPCKYLLLSPTTMMLFLTLLTRQASKEPPGDDPPSPQCQEPLIKSHAQASFAHTHWKQAVQIILLGNGILHNHQRGPAKVVGIFHQTNYQTIHQTASAGLSSCKTKVSQSYK